MSVAAGEACTPWHTRTGRNDSRTAANGAHTRTNPADGGLVNDDDEPARVGSDLEVALGEVTAYHTQLASDGYECPLLVTFSRQTTPIGLTLDTWGDEKKWVVLRCPDGYSYPTAAQKSATKRQTGKKKAK